VLKGEGNAFDFLDVLYFGICLIGQFYGLGEPGVGEMVGIVFSIEVIEGAEL
jgi:hypothetical protein